MSPHSHRHRFRSGTGGRYFMEQRHVHPALCRGNGPERTGVLPSGEPAGRRTNQCSDLYGGRNLPLFGRFGLLQANMH